jgi:hypothetical protein
MGDYKMMDKFISNMPLDTPMHDGLVKYIISNNLFIQKLDIGLAIIIANCIGESYLNFAEISNKRTEWFNAYHNYEQRDII